MKHLRTLCLVGLFALAVGSARAQQFVTGDITVEKPWTRATPKGAAVAAGYLTIRNRGAVADKLTGGSADFAGAIEVHEMSMKDGVMTMRQLAGGLEIPANGAVTLAPNGYHLMFQGLKRQLSKGETVKATLTFEHAGSLPVEFPVGRIGAMGPGGAKAPAAAIHEGRVARLSGRYPDEVQPLVGDLNELLLRQEDIAAKARARAADLAHGLKTPLAVLDALVAEAREVGQSSLADEIAAELSSMKGHVERELARARSGQSPTFIRQRTPVRPVIDRLTAALGKIAGRDELRFEIDCPRNAIFVGSENDLFDMLGNILDNGRKWAAGLVRVTVAARDSGLVIEIEDDGPGLAGDLRSEDIVRALRLDETHAGTGFGLAITKEIAVANRGTLELASSELGGLKVTLAFQA